MPRMRGSGPTIGALCARSVGRHIVGLLSKQMSLSEEQKSATSTPLVGEKYNNNNNNNKKKKTK